MANFFKSIKTVPPFVTWIAAKLIVLYTKTLRIRIIDPEGFLGPDGPFPVVATVWHNRILFLGPCCPAARREKFSILISASRDGRHIANVIHGIGFRSVAGSSSRGGTQALRQLLTVLESGNSIIIPVDGPRGPRYQPHLGAASLADLSGVPILAASLNAPSRWEVKSWDRLQIPKPFSRVTLVIGKTRPFPAELRNDRPGMENFLNSLLMEITDDRRN